MPILDVRGTHGSGKSWVVHRLLGAQPHNDIEEGGQHLGYYLPGIDLAVVGRYSTKCGGCDGVGSADEVVRRVRRFAREYRNVLLEGILVAHTFKRYSSLANELSPLPYHFCFLNTPLKTCLARVKARRLAKGDERPLKPDNVVGDWHNIWEGVRTKCVAAGHSVVILDYRDPLKNLLELLE